MPRLLLYRCNMPIKMAIEGKCPLDSRIKCGINILTFYLRKEYANVAQNGSKEAGTYRGRHIKSFAREGQRPKVSRERILRSTGHCAGQIRNVAPCVCRERLGNGCRHRVWCLKTSLLSGKSKLGQSRYRGTGAEKARSSSASQDRWNHIGVYRETDRGRRTDSSSTIVQRNSTEIQDQGSPANNRACTCRKKNSSLNKASFEVATSNIQHAAQYECLRMAALGSALPVEARSGLAIFLRRGMWGWIKAATRDFTPVAFPPSSSVSIQHSTLVQIFASLAFTLCKKTGDRNERINESATSTPTS